VSAGDALGPLLGDELVHQWEMSSGCCSEVRMTLEIRGRELRAALGLALAALALGDELGTSLGARPPPWRQTRGGAGKLLGEPLGVVDGTPLGEPLGVELRTGRPAGRSWEEA
jgi:hypothetical protein